MSPSLVYISPFFKDIETIIYEITNLLWKIFSGFLKIDNNCQRAHRTGSTSVTFKLFEGPIVAVQDF